MKASTSQRKTNRTAALQAALKLTRAADSLNRGVALVTEPAGITLAQYLVLEAVDHAGSLCQRDIAEKTFRSPGNVTVIVTNLERAGLVRRERGNGSQKLVTVRLTPRGEKMLAGLRPAVEARIAAVFDGLSSAEVATLARLTRRVGLVAAKF